MARDNMKCPTLEDLPAPPQEKKGWPWTEGSARVCGDPQRGSGRPRITVVTPSYNQGEFLEETIRSVLLQGYPNIEYIVMDGGSEDGSVTIIKKYEQWLAHWVSEPDRGQSHAINKGFERGTGEVFAWLNSDDSYSQDTFETVGRHFLACDSPLVLVGAGEKRDPEGRLLYQHLPERLTRQSILEWGEDWLVQPACFFSAAVYRRVGGVKEDLRYAFDVDLWLRLWSEAEFRLVDRCLARTTVHPQAKTRAERGKVFAETCFVQIRHGGEQEAFERIASLYDRARRQKEKLDRVRNHILYRVIRPWLNLFSRR